MIGQVDHDTVLLSGYRQIAETRNVGGGGQIDLVYAILEKSNQIISMALREDKGVLIACPVGIVSDEIIVTLSAIDYIRACSTKNPVTSFPSVQCIVIFATREDIVAFSTVNRVVALVAIEIVAILATIKLIVALAAVERVLTRFTLDQLARLCLRRKSAEQALHHVFGSSSCRARISWMSPGSFDTSQDQ